MIIYRHMINRVGSQAQASLTIHPCYWDNIALATRSQLERHRMDSVSRMYKTIDSSILAFSVILPLFTKDSFCCCTQESMHLSFPLFSVIYSIYIPAIFCATVNMYVTYTYFISSIQYHILFSANMFKKSRKGGHIYNI